MYSHQLSCPLVILHEFLPYQFCEWSRVSDQRDSLGVYYFFMRVPLTVFVSRSCLIRRKDFLILFFSFYLFDGVFLQYSEAHVIFLFQFVLLPTWFGIYLPSSVSIFLFTLLHGTLFDIKDVAHVQKLKKFSCDFVNLLLSVHFLSM